MSDRETAVMPLLHRRSMAATLVALALSSCAFLTRVEVGVTDAHPDDARARFERSALEPGELSDDTRYVLHAFDATELFESDPDAALRALHAAAAEEPSRDVCFALAELSYARATERASREHFVASAVYAYLYLLGGDGAELASPFDRRFRWACDIYNSALRRALTDAKGRVVRLEACERELPTGRVRVSVDSSGFPWSAEASELLAADSFAVFGLNLRHRSSGLGVPLIVTPRPSANTGRVAPHLCMPATVLLRVDGRLSDLERGLDATLELRSGLDEPSARVGDRDVPLEIDFTAPLAYTLQRPAIWKFNLTGLFGGSAGVPKNQLLASRPYEPGRIPIVFVHGTASNPAYWAEMFNALQADPLLRQRTQCWFFLYENGSSIAYSAAKLRDALRERVRELDPDGRDGALRRMVVIGHSQGGLLARMLVTDGDLHWLSDMVGSTLAELELPEEQAALVRWAFDFDPLDTVARVVFIATPHRGSFLAGTWFTRALAKLIALPQDLTALGRELVERAKRLPGEPDPLHVPTSLDNMSPSNPFLLRLARAPIADDVAVHSIVAVTGDGPAEEGDDGVVAYSSAHLAEVDSELVVRCGHSCQAHPRTIREVRRILLEHLLASGAPLR